MPSKKILIVDDDESILKVLEISLQGRGYQIQTAVSAEVAFEKLKSDVFDLVVLDYYLPKIDGTQICRSLRTSLELAKNKKTLVLMLSGKMETADLVLKEIKKFGANDFLAKPFEMKDLLEKIKTLLGN